MLSLSKLEEGNISASPELFNISEYTQSVLQELNPVLKPGQNIQYHHVGLVEVYLDLKFLKNILFNLGSNAIKFSPENKPIDIITKVGKDTIEISVQDYGIGIPEEEQGHLFQRFFRAHNVTNIQGTGLGLNIVSRYVELMNGNITFQSKPDEGTLFLIKLPNYIEQ